MPQRKVCGGYKYRRTLLEFERMIVMFKVNLHLLEACNFRCRTCFAHFDSKRLLSVDEWKRIIDNLYKSGRVNAVNFAGGEPFIYPRLGELVEYAHGLNLKVSIITNGSLITQAWLDRYAHCIDMIGFSIDSFDRNISIAMGRCSCQGQTFGINEFLQIYPQLLAHNIKIKINTVVNKINYREQFSHNLAGLRIDRWKVLKMKAFDNGRFSNHDLAITMEQFNFFVKNNPYKNRIVEDSMVNSYFVIDANGDLLDNSPEAYGRVGSLLTESFNEVFARFNFDRALYESRYTEHELHAA